MNTAVPGADAAVALPVAVVAPEFPSLAAVPSLADGEVLLVATRLAENFVATAGHWSLLGPAETGRARRLRFDHHRNRWVAARAMLKQLLGGLAGCAPGAVRLRFGAIGKPYLAEPAGDDIRFNYTDSNGCLLYAFARGIEVGVDLEYLPRPTRYEALARRKLSRQEYDAFCRLAEADREVAFLAGWTRKEAYGKALGVGVRYPMQEVTLCRDFAQPWHTVHGEDGEHHLVQVQPPFPGVACVAASAPFSLRGCRLSVSP